MLDFIKSLSLEIVVIYGLMIAILLLTLLVLIIDYFITRKKLLKTNKTSDMPLVKEVDLMPITDVQVQEKPESFAPKIEEVVITPVIKETPTQEVKTDDKEYTMYNFTVPKIDPIQEIKYVEENPELERTNAQLELERITKELRKAEDTQELKPIEFTNYELIQEEDAIISLEELKEKESHLMEINEEVQYMDEGNEPINLEELKAKFNTTEINIIAPEVIDEEKEVIKLDDFNEVTSTSTPYEKKLEASPIISPIFGFEKDLKPQEVKPFFTPSSMEFEQTADYEKLDLELRKTNDFLRQLKELEKNLD